MKRYEVIWDDAHGDTSMFTEEEMTHKPYRFTSIGYLLKSDPVGISMCREYGDDGNLRDHMFIPRAMVVSEKEIVEQKPRKKRTIRKVVPPDTLPTESKLTETP